MLNLDQRGFANFLVIGILLVGIVGGLFLVTHPTVFKPKALGLSDPIPVPSYDLRLTAGNSYTDSDGAIWNNANSYCGPHSNYSTNSGIANTHDQSLYHSELYGGFTCTFTQLPSGSYTVTLKFAEIFFDKPGQRIFNVSINGNQVLTNFDIVAQAGANTAIDKTFTVNVTNGQIQVTFIGVQNNAKFSAMRITSASNTVPTPTSSCTTSNGDANKDGIVNTADYNIWNAEFTGQDSGKKADFNCDGKVDGVDFTIWKNASTVALPADQKLSALCSAIKTIQNIPLLGSLYTIYCQ